jgi:cGMP-dependent protein kinase
MLITCEYLHKQNIVHRDIRPEKFMINDKGSLLLMDMRSAKVLQKLRGEYRTTTVVGTPHYMAPEIIAGNGYSFAVDYWSIGVCLFEFMWGTVPFGDGMGDPMQIYESILGTELAYPKNSMSADKKKAEECISIMLSRCPEARTLGEVGNLKSIEFFDKIDWTDLLRGTQKPIHFPPVYDVISQAGISEAIKRDHLIGDRVREDHNITFSSLKSNTPEWDAQF